MTVGQVTIKLVDSEVDVAKTIAEKRDQYHRDRGNKTAEYWTDDFLETAWESVGAELAVARYLNVYPLPIRIVDVPPKWDLIFMHQYIDVKSRLASGSKDLLIPYLHLDVLYVLVIVDSPAYTIMGFIPGGQVNGLGKFVDLGKKKCWKVTPDKLLEINRLESYLRQSS
jgi:hypothetical protein